MKTVMITGGYGFIGSHLVKHFLDETDYRVVNVDCMTYAANRKNLDGISRDRYHFLPFRIETMESMDRVFDVFKPTHVINCAAESHVDRSIESSSDFVTTNVLGTSVMLELARRHSVQRFLQVSTDEVYGSLGHEGTFTEDTRLSPRSPYSASKAAADLMVEAFGHTHGLDYVITRCTNNFGPGQHTEKFMPNTITRLMRGEKIPIYGSGENVRDWIYVTDHCRGIHAALEKGEAGNVYNFSGGNEVSNIDCARMIIDQVAQMHPHMDRDSMLSTICHIEDRKGHDFRYSMSSEKSMSKLGWSRLVSFNEGLERTIEHYSVI